MWEEWIVALLYSLVTLLYGSIFTLLFLEIEWRNRRNAAAFLAYVLIAMGLQGIIGYFYSIDQVVYLYPLIVHIPLLLLCTLVYRKHVLTTVASILLCYFLTSPRYILSELLTLLLPEVSYAENIGKILASFLLVYPIYRWMVPVTRKSFQRNTRDVMHFFTPLIVLYTFSYLLYVYTDLLVINGVLMMEIVFTLFFLFIFFYLQKYFVSMDEKFQEEKKNQMLELSTEALKKQLDIVNENNEQTRMLRHDMRHYATMVRQYVTLGEVEKVVAISEEMEAKNNAVAERKYCVNPWVNLLLDIYISQIESGGVVPTVKIIVPEKIYIQEMDLCVILGNVLDNAVRSISGCGQTKFCSIHLQYDAGKLYLEVQNSCEDTVSFQDGIPLSGRNGHGYGCKSIEYITEKYHGICSFELQKNVFVTRVILHEA